VPCVALSPGGPDDERKEALTDEEIRERGTSPIGQETTDEGEGRGATMKVQVHVTRKRGTKECMCMRGWLKSSAGPDGLAPKNDYRQKRLSNI